MGLVISVGEEGEIKGKEWFGKENMHLSRILIMSSWRLHSTQKCYLQMPFDDVTFHLRKVYISDSVGFDVITVHTWILSPIQIPNYQSLIYDYIQPQISKYSIHYIRVHSKRWCTYNANSSKCKLCLTESSTIPSLS